MYIPVFWQDRIVEHPRRVRVTDLGNGIKEWAPDPGEISQKGTSSLQRISEIWISETWKTHFWALIWL